MIGNLPFARRKSLIERQLHELNAIEYNNDRHEKIEIFKRKTKQIFRKVLSDSDEYISDLEGISYSPLVYTFDERYDHALEYDSFQSGVQQATTLLRSAISNIEIEKELSDEDKETEEKSILQNGISRDTNKVFIVHGHDDGLKNEVALFIKRLGLEEIILHERTNRGKTIIEKFEANSDVGFAIVLYTPCDVGRSISSSEDKTRARQNVIFEHGYFVAKLGREHVVALNKGDVEIPNDLSGMIYISYEKDDWKRQIAHELKESGYEIDFSKV